MRTRRAVLFDVGGTLLSEDAYDLEAGVAAILEAPGVRELVQRPGAWAAELTQWVEWIHREGRSDRSLVDWLRERLTAAAHEALAPITLLEWERRLWQAGVFMSPMDGALDVLARLRSDGLPTAAVSNTIFSAETMRAALDDAGLGADLRFVLSSCQAGIAKPDPRIFRLALERLGTEAEETWFVGDSWDNDVVGAAGAGLQAVWLSEGRAEVSGIAHRRVATMQELLELLDT